MNKRDEVHDMKVKMKMNANTCLFLLGLPFLLAACATTNSPRCQNANWTQIGREDAGRLKPVTTVEEHQNLCGRPLEIQERVQYESGWKMGIVDLCTAAGGYRAGVKGLTVDNLCSPAQHPEFFEQYRIGFSVRELMVQRRHVVSQIETRNGDTSVLANFGRAVSVVQGRSPTAELDERKILLDERIMAIDQNAPGGPQARSADDLGDLLRHPDFRLRHWSGVFFGSIYGFGIGHAIQGRYRTSGWKWTLGETAILGTLVAANMQACQEPEDVYTRRIDGTVTITRECHRMGASAPYIPLALVAWLGFRIWQSYDLFRNPDVYQAAKPSPSNSMLVADLEGLKWFYQF